MKVSVKFFAYLSDYIDDNVLELELVEGANISNLLDFLCKSYGIQDILFDNHEKLKSWVSILKNGREIHFLEGLKTKLKNGDEIAIFPPVAGG
ncbi:MAG: MoaD/ThiS family protein [Promethearchaeota archaeon]|nr:MAG: MoaD/ThiS family protein [Candidatus Lokiarchaeota archaeon]